MGTRRVGVILVHGIGEQKRFEHLEAQIRELVVAIKRRPRTAVSVEILPGRGAVYHAEQDTWAAGEEPSARISVLDASGTDTEINIHEVWWADVNEPYSLSKQLRFWAWGLSVWAFPRSDQREDLPAFEEAMLSPALTGAKARPESWIRAQLYLSGLFFLVAAFSVGAAVFLAKRLLGFEAPRPVRVFVNYISGVKLYNQKSRRGAGLGTKESGFLDTLDDPPRVSIRRRMVRTLAMVAGREEYDGWYILAHSLGTVVAFNGIMEYGQALANYLNRDEWRDLVARGWAGPGRSGKDWFKDPPGAMSPTRPVWLGNRDVVYRDKIFERFEGILTYGSPLGKFAALWPVRVPVNKVEMCFRDGTEWINVFDPRDPVSGALKAFDKDRLANLGITPRHCPPMRTIGYASSPVLLVSHIRYLTRRDDAGPQLCDSVAEWLIGGRRFAHPPLNGERWFEAGSPTYWSRLYATFGQWLLTGFALAVLGTVSFFGLWDALVAFVSKLPGWLCDLVFWLVPAVKG